MAKCKGKTAKGKKCNRNAPDGADYCCEKHNPDSADTSKKWWAAFFDAFRETGIVKEAAAIAEIDRSTVYAERKSDPEFARLWEEIEEDTTQAMEREAIRRGMTGVEKPVFHKGEVCGHVKEYSDTLLIFMLKSRRPEVYRERHEVQHTGNVRHEVGIAIPADATSSDLTAVADELAERRARREQAAAA